MSTRNLKEIILALLHEHHLLSTKGILKLLELQGKKYNKTSVYRAVEQLRQDSLICQHYFQEAEAFYELKEHHHSHLICRKCGKIATLECDYQQPQNVPGFRIDHHHITLMGECETCC